MIELSELLFPSVTQTPKDIFILYPARPGNPVVTRIAPSPTGFLHFGAVYSAMLDKIVAHQNDGVFFLRIEDTDKKREVAGAAKNYIEILKRFGLTFDEGPIGPDGQDVGAYGPYTQSERKDIYQVFLKDLVVQGKAYPCFLTEEEITDTRAIQEATKAPTGIYGEYSPWRYASLEQVKEALDARKKFVIRLKSQGELTKKIIIKDLVKGSISTQENFLDVVIMKQDGIPTYHFAHAIDDHLMGTTHVIRGDEWFASVPLHQELFETLGWNAPQYAHYGPLVKLDGTSRRKLSKRKDPEADVEYYFEKGYSIEGILDFLSNILNSGFEEWRKQNPGVSYLEYDFQLSKVNSSGALVDIEKLNFVNSHTLSTWPPQKLYEAIASYLKEYNTDFYEHIFQTQNPDYNMAIITELQKRFVTFDEYEAITRFFYHDFEITQEIKEMLINPKMKIDSLDFVKKSLQLALDILRANISHFTSLDTIKEVFLETIQSNGLKNGQVLWPLRVALSGEQYSPGAFELVSLLGVQKSIQRVEKLLLNL